MTSSRKAPIPCSSIITPNEAFRKLDENGPSEILRMLDDEFARIENKRNSARKEWHASVRKFIEDLFKEE